MSGGVTEVQVEPLHREEHRSEAIVLWGGVPMEIAKRPCCSWEVSVRRRRIIRGPESAAGRLVAAY